MGKKLTDISGDGKKIKLEIPPHTGGKNKLYKPEYANMAGRLVAAGFGEQDLGYTFNCAKGTIKTWKKRYPEFKAACIEGKRREVQKLVAKALYAAGGYDYTVHKAKTIRDKDGKITKTEETNIDTHQPANERLLVFLLANFSNQLGDNEWISTKKLEIEQKNISVQITGDAASLAIQKLAGGLLTKNQRKQIESKDITKAILSEN